jgi:hypothetical protein
MGSSSKQHLSMTPKNVYTISYLRLYFRTSNCPIPLSIEQHTPSSTIGSDSISDGDLYVTFIGGLLTLALPQPA